MAETPRVLLLVVQTKAQRSLLNQLLGATPHHLVFASDGEEAYDRFSEVKPDAVVAHLRAARVDGAVLCQVVRNRLGGTQVPFVLIGEATDEREAVRRLKEVDADLFVAVPGNEEQLKDELFRLLALGRQSTDVRARPLLTRALESADQPPGEATEEDDTGIEPLQTETHDLGDAAPPVVSNDMDTVVSFKNPFFDASFASVTNVEAPDREEHVTHVAIERPLLDLQAEADTGLDGPVESAGSAPLDGAPSLDPLEEPRISGRDVGKKPITANSLIAEVPRERTPTGDSGERGLPTAGVRRGLDESQLGKRLAKRVRAMYRQLERADFYELLGVSQQVDFAGVRQAYYELSLEFHPDRFFLLRSGDLKEKIYAIYRRVGEAFRVLGDEAQRQAYDSALRTKGAGPRTDTRSPDALDAAANTDSAQRYVELAQAAFAAGDVNHARLMLTLASAVEQDNPSLRTALGQVVETTKPTV